MTVRDLVMGASESLEGMQITVRENGGGKWIQGFRISKKARLYPCDARIEEREKHPWVKETCSRGSGLNCPVPEGEVVTVVDNFFKYPIKVMCIDPRKAPKDVLELEVKSYLPRNLPTIHGDKLYNNEFCLEIDCYEPEQREKLAVYREIIGDKVEDDQLAGQMSIEDFLGGD
jgi:hypothetical protein